MEKKRQVLVIGVDGLDPNLLTELMGGGLLPHFSSLAEKGYFSPLKTVVPPQSPAAWTTIATGCTPAEHGIYDFLTRGPGEYTPKLAILRQGKLGYVRPYPSKTFWETASDRSIPATIIKWPLTFPAPPLHGSLLAGLGTPDIRGTLGRYSFFTSQEMPEVAKKKGAIVKVDASKSPIKTSLLGPLTFSLHGTTEASVPLEMEAAEGYLVCRLPESSFKLAVGDWSPWIHLNFKIGFMRRVSGICRFYLESLEPDLNLYVTPINLAHDMKSMPISYPPGYAKELSGSIGPFATLGLAEDSNALDEELISENAFLSGCDLIMQEREDIFFHELQKFQEGILSCVFDTTDRIQHMFWRHLKTGSEYAGVIPRFYGWVDDILGKALARAGHDALIIVCSDHGFASFRRMVHLNTWLKQNGFLALKEGLVTRAPSLAQVDWSKTSAFAFGLNSLYLNLKNREPQGVVPADQVAGLKVELAAKLKALTDGGNPVVRNVYDPAELYGQKPDERAPDLIIGYEKGYRSSWQTALGEVPDGEVIEDNLRKWSGDHCCDPELVPGVWLTNMKGLVQRPHVRDICPAILDYLS